MKQQLIIWEKIFENDVSERGPVSRAYKEHLQLMIKEKITYLQVDRGFKQMYLQRSYMDWGKAVSQSLNMKLAGVGFMFLF